MREQTKEMEVSDVTITIKHTNNDRFSGYYRPFWYPEKKEDRPQVLVRIPKPGIQIHDYKAYRRTVTEQGKDFPLNTWQEALVAIVAHELMHHRQSSRRQYGRIKGRGRFVEVECDLAAYRAVARRRGEL